MTHVKPNSGSEYKFPYPLFVTWYQLFVALLLLILCGYLGKQYATLFWFYRR